MIAWCLGSLQSGREMIACASLRLQLTDAQYRNHDISVTPSRRCRTAAAGRSHLEDAPCAAGGLHR